MHPTHNPTTTLTHTLIKSRTLQGLSLAVWSYAKLGYAPLVLLQVTAEICKGRFADFTAAQMTRVAWSFARCVHGCSVLVSGVTVL